MSGHLQATFLKGKGGDSGNPGFSQLEEQKAIAAAATGRPSWLPLWLFRRSVVAVVQKPVQLLRIRTHSLHRRIVQCHAQTASRSRQVNPPADPKEFDPWHVSSALLVSQTRRLVTCQVCSGERKVRCDRCLGTALIPFGSCRGLGRTRGLRGQRQCPGCRGQLSKRCPCRDGLLPCAQCEGKGRLEHWLEVTESAVERVAVGGDPELESSFPSCRDAVGFDRRLPSWPDIQLRQWAAPSVAELPDDCRTRLDLHRVRPPPAEPGERAMGVEVQDFASAKAIVRFRFMAHEGAIAIHAWDQRVNVEDSAKASFRQLGQLIKTVGLSTLMLSSALILAPTFRFPFLSLTAAVVTGGLLALGLAALSSALAASLALPGGNRPRQLIATSSLMLPLMLLAELGLAHSIYPSFAHALQAVGRGQLLLARLELAACVKSGVAADAASRLHDDLLLEELRKIAQISALWPATEQPFLTATGRKAATELALARTAAAAVSLVGSGSFREAATSLDLVPQQLRTSPLLREAALRLAKVSLGACVAERDAACIPGVLRNASKRGLDASAMTQLKDHARSEIEAAVPELWDIVRSRRGFSERIVACGHLLDLATLAQAVGDEGVSVASRERVRAACEQIRKVESDRLDQQVQEKQRRHQRALERWATAPLRCRDGSLSPSCVCGQGSHRGCCSWHGGVAGCSADLP